MNDKVTPEPTARAFELRSVGEHEWLIYDHHYPADDAGILVACLSVNDRDEIDVTWLADVPLPTSYLVPLDVLDEFVRWKTGTGGGEVPQLIPHYQPPATR